MPDVAAVAVPQAGRIGDVLPVRLSCLAKPRGHQASELCLFKANQCDLSFIGGQGPIVHLEAESGEAVAWAEPQLALGLHTLERRLDILRRPTPSR